MLQVITEAAYKRIALCRHPVSPAHARTQAGKISHTHTHTEAEVCTLPVLWEEKKKRVQQKGINSLENAMSSQLKPKAASSDPSASSLHAFPVRMKLLLVAAALLAVASCASVSLEEMEFHAWKLKFGECHQPGCDAPLSSQG